MIWLIDMIYVGYCIYGNWEPGFMFTIWWIVRALNNNSFIFICVVGIDPTRPLRLQWSTWALPLWYSDMLPMLYLLLSWVAERVVITSIVLSFPRHHQKAPIIVLAYFCRYFEYAWFIPSNQNKTENNQQFSTTLSHLPIIE